MDCDFADLAEGLCWATRRRIGRAGVCTATIGDVGVVVADMLDAAGFSWDDLESYRALVAEALGGKAGGKGA